MREIKFRAWVVDEEKMIYPNERNYYIRNDGKLFRIVNLSDKKGQNFLNIETESVLMQYTGLKDKNGVEIYEGDRVRHETGNPDGQFIVEDVTYNGGAFYPVCTQPGKTFEIIGNKYEVNK